MKGAVLFARGALGDSILTWPLLRALANQYELVAAVMDLSKAQLARRIAVPSLVAMSAEQDLFNRLYVQGAKIDAVEAAASINLVIHLAPGAMSSAAALTTWRHNAQMQYPRARIEIETGELNRISALALAEKWGTVRPLPPVLTPPTDSTCFFVGAGSAEKRWPLPFWGQLIRSVPDRKFVVIAGEAECDRFSPFERKLFESLGGVFLSNLLELEGILRMSSVFVGVDSGPTHLAAQMGLDTIALFGPTDPGHWAPIGPRVEVVAPEYPRGMAWLSVREVASRLSRRKIEA